MKQTKTIGLKPFLSPNEVAELTGISLATLTSNRYEGRGFPFVKFGRSVRYRSQDVIDWADAHTYASTAEAKAAE